MVCCDLYQGSPEFLFEHFLGLSDLTKRKNIYWPTQTMLMILCPDLISHINVDKNSNSSMKKFLDLLKKSLKSKLADVATFCYVDICRVCSFLSKTDGVSMRVLVPNIETELKVLFHCLSRKNLSIRLNHFCRRKAILTLNSLLIALSPCTSLIRGTCFGMSSPVYWNGLGRLF